MAKIYGLFGAMTGKLADAVMVVRNGEQIVRKYQPIVSNPATAKQIAARAKLKLLSQLSAVFGSVVAIPREGAVSSRNLFTKDNYPLVTYANNIADVNLTSIQLTRSVVALPSIIATPSAGSITIGLTEGDPDVDSVVYVIMQRTADEKLRLVGSAVASTPGSGFRFSYTREIPAGGNVVVYAYGIRINSEVGRAIFGNLNVPTAEQVAKLVVSRSVSSQDITLTETRAALATIPPQA